MYDLNSSAANSTDVTENKRFLFLDVVGFVVIPVILLGNVMIIAAVSRFKTLRNPSNIMILFLAVGDLMIGVVLMPMKMLMFHRENLFMQRVPCLVNIFSGYVSVTTAMFFLSMLSVERFYAVQFPFHYHAHVTTTLSVLWCTLTFLVAVSICLPIMCGIDTWIPGNVCFGNINLPAMYVLTVVSFVFLVSLAGFFSFLRVLSAAISSRMKERSLQRLEGNRRDSIKTTLMLTVYIFSILCWMPQLIYLIITLNWPYIKTLLGLRIVSILAVSSSGVNFFIYGVKNTKFRNAFKLMFSLTVKRGHVSPASSSLQHRTE